MCWKDGEEFHVGVVVSSLVVESYSMSPRRMGTGFQPRDSVEYLLLRGKSISPPSFEGDHFKSTRLKSASPSSFPSFTPPSL